MQLNVAKAVEYYYGTLEIGTSDIQVIFNCSKAKAVELKKIARAAQVESELMFMDTRKVSTKIAYKSWGINIREITHNYGKMVKLGLINNQINFNNNERICQ